MSDPLMSRSSHLASTHRGQPRSAQPFFGREDLVATGDGFFDRFFQPGGNPQPVLNMWGVGGVGKSTLVKKIVANALARFPNLYVPYIDLDTDSMHPQIPLGTFFWSIRNELHAVEVPTPLFDCLYFYYWRLEHPSEVFALESSPFREAIAKGERGSELLAPLQTMVGAAAEAVASIFKALQIVDTVANGIRDRFRRKGIADLTNEAMDAWSKRTIIERFPDILAYDVSEFLVDNPYAALCLVFDGFDRVQSNRVRIDAQNLLQRFLGQVIATAAERGRHSFGAIVSGRRRLMWGDLYGEYTAEQSWPAVFETHRLRGLSRIDAERLLADTASPLATTEGTAGHRLALAEVEEILEAAQETTEPDDAATYLPFYLGLAARSSGGSLRRSDAAHSLGGAASSRIGRAIEERFLNTIEDAELKAMQVLALAGEFDAELFRWLVHEGVIVGHGQHEFWHFIDDSLPYVSHHNHLGHYHRHMQAALMRSLTSQGAQSTARDALQIILRFHADRAAFVSISAWTEDNTRHYTRGLNALLSACEQGLATRDDLATWWKEIEGPINNLVAPSARLPISDRRRRYLRKDRAPGDLIVSATLHTANCLLFTGDFAAMTHVVEQALREYPEPAAAPEWWFFLRDVAVNVMVIQGRLEDALHLATSQMAWSNKHGDAKKTTFAKYKYASVLADMDRSLEALPILQELYTASEGGPEDVREMVRICLEGCYGALGYYDRALELSREGLATAGRLHPGDPSWEAGALSSLGARLLDAGLLEDAIQRKMKALSVYENCFGPTHPAVAVELFGIACALERQGQFAEALAQLERASGIERMRLPPKSGRHMATAVVKARLLWKSGKTEAAEALYASLMETSNTPHMRQSLSFGYLLRDLAELRASTAPMPDTELIDSSLAIMMAALGRDHPQVLRSATISIDHRVRSGDLATAEALARATWEAARTREGPQSDSAVACLINFAGVVQLRRRYKSAVKLWRQVLTDLRVAARFDEDGPLDVKDPDRQRMWNGALVLTLLGEASYHAIGSTVSKACHAMAIKFFERLGAEGGLVADLPKMFVAKCVAREGDWRDAAEFLRHGLEKDSEQEQQGDAVRHSEQDIVVLHARRELATVLWIGEQYEEAEVEVRRTLQCKTETAVEDAVKGDLLMMLGRLLRRNKRIEEAEQAFRGALALRRKCFDPFDEPIAESLYALALCLGPLGRPAEALPMQREVTNIYRELAALDPEYELSSAYHLAELGAVHMAVHDYQASIGCFREYLAALDRLGQSRSRDSISSRRLLAEALLEEDRYEEAIDAVDAAVKVAEEHNVGDLELVKLLNTALSIESKSQSPEAAATAARLRSLRRRDQITAEN